MRNKKTCNTGVIHKMVLTAGTVGVAMLSFRVARLFLSGLVVGLQRPKEKD